MAKTISFVKGKGSLRHDNREFIASNIDEERVSWNVAYIQQPLKEAYEEIFGPAVDEYNARQKRNERKIDNYLNKIKNSGNNEKQFYETVVQIGKKDDTGILDEKGNITEAALQAKEVLDEYARTFQDRNPNLILFNAVLHMDEATPHLHLDYIPVAHGYKTGLKTRNSLTKGLQEMGIAPAVSNKDTETMHWQERERAFITELCREHGIEIEVLGVDRDNYSIPEYKQAMREKEAAEAEIEILNAEKTEIETEIESLDDELESGHKEINEQKDILNGINEQITMAKKTVAAKEKEMDKIMESGKSVEKEIKDIRSKTSDVPNFFGGEQMVKLPKKVYDKMISRYRVAGTFENLSRKYETELSAKQEKNNKLTEQINTLKAKIKQHTDFLGKCGLLEAFAEFIRPKSIREKIATYSKEVEKEKTKTRVQSIGKNRRDDIAI